MREATSIMANATSIHAANRLLRCTPKPRPITAIPLELTLRSLRREPGLPALGSDIHGWTRTLHESLGQNPSRTAPCERSRLFTFLPYRPGKSPSASLRASAHRDDKRGFPHKPLLSCWYGSG